MRATRRRLGAGFGAVAICLTLASAAYACAVLATLSVSPERARKGTTVTGSGGNYRVNTDPSAPTVSDVFITLDRRDAAPLATVTPNPDRTIDFTFTIPSNIEPGWHVVLATQYNLADGSPVAGTPGRASLKVRRSGNGALVPVAWEPQRPLSAGEPAAAPGLVPLPAAAANALLALGLAGALTISWAAFGRRKRARAGTL
jgi:hypothetical protein